MKFKIKHVFYVVCAFGTILVFFMWSETVVNYSYILFYQNSDVILNKVAGTKYVLQWTSPTTEPFVFMGIRHETFTKRNCSKKNCYVSSNRDLFNDITAFDVVLFHGPEIVGKTKLPSTRSTNQSYIFVSMESSAYYPVPNDRYNNFFNFTWTYKLNSDIFYGYIIIRNNEGDVIGPSAVMSWISVDDMLPIKDTVKRKLAHKKIAAAWFVSNCYPRNNRSEVAKEVANELRKYNMTVDVYGKCGSKQFPRDAMDGHLYMLQRDYYFYFAFENSMSNDYVTEKLLHALQNYAVPVVFGGANYERFMPDGIYLNALELGVKKLVYQMVEIINDKNKYYNFFKWHSHYSYHNPEETIDTDPYCQFCDYINKVDLLNESSIVADFKDWWNPHAPGWN